MGLADLLPDSQEVGLLLGQHDDPVVVLQALEQHFDLGADFGRLLELVECNRALALEAELENDCGVGETENPRFDDLALAKLLKVGAELRQQRLELSFRGRERLFAEWIVNELGRDAFRHVGNRDGGGRLLGGLFGGYLFCGKRGDFTRKGIDDDFLAFSEIALFGVGVLRIGHDHLLASRTGGCEAFAGARGTNPG